MTDLTPLAFRCSAASPPEVLHQPPPGCGPHWLLHVGIALWLSPLPAGWLASLGKRSWPASSLGMGPERASHQPKGGVTRAATAPAPGQARGTPATGGPRSPRSHARPGFCLPSGLASSYLLGQTHCPAKGTGLGSARPACTSPSRESGQVKGREEAAQLG